MSVRLTILIIFLLPLRVDAQAFQIDKPALSIDSLQKVLPLLRDSARIDCLNELGLSYIASEIRVGAVDSAWTYLRKSYAEAYAINYIQGLGDACLNLGQYTQWYLWNQNEVEKYYREAIYWYNIIQDENGLGHAFLGSGRCLLNGSTLNVAVSPAEDAIKAFKQSIIHFKKTGNRVMLAELIDQFGYVYNKKGDFEKYFESIKKGLREKKRIGDNRGLIWSYYRLAHIYRQAGDYETALDYFRQSYRQAHSLSITWHIGRSMGDIFLNMKNYDSSIYYYHNVFVRLPADGRALAGLGKLYVLRKEYGKALNYLLKAIKSYEKIKDEDGIMWASVDVGKSFFELKQYEKASQYAKQCLTIARLRESKDGMQHAFEIYWKVYDGIMQKDSAYFYFVKFISLRDSLEDARFKLQTIQKLALFKVEAKEEQQLARINLLRKDNQIKLQQLQEEALQKKILAGSLAALGLLSIIILRNLSLKRRNEKHRREIAENELLIQKLESEKTKAEFQKQTTELEMQALRAQMNPHFIFNSLNSINNFILQNNKAQASEYLNKFSKLVRLILQNSQVALIPLDSELESLKLYLELESVRFDHHFDFTILVDESVDAEVVKVPPLIIQPYAENAIWHGLMQKEEKGHLEISIFQEAAMICCKITDDGIGRKKAAVLKSKSASTHKSMGMQITASRIEMLQHQKQMDTNIKITDLVLADGSAGGTEVLLKIPVMQKD